MKMYTHASEESTRRAGQIQHDALMKNRIKAKDDNDAHDIRSEAMILNTGVVPTGDFPTRTRILTTSTYGPYLPPLRTDIVALSAGFVHSAAIIRGGTAVAWGDEEKWDDEKEMLDVECWTDLVAIAVGEYHTVGLRTDGTVVACGTSTYGECDVEAWHDVVGIGRRHRRRLREHQKRTESGGFLAEHRCGRCRGRSHCGASVRRHGRRLRHKRIRPV